MKLRESLLALLAYPAAASAFLVGLLWPSRLPLPGACIRLLAGSPDPRALAMAELRLRIERLRLRVLAPGRRGSLLRPFTMPVFYWRLLDGETESRWRDWCRSLLPAFRYAPRSRAAIVQGWSRGTPRKTPALFLDWRLRNSGLQMLRCLADPDCRLDEQHFSKLELWRRCEARAIPCAPVFASFERGRIDLLELDALASARALFSKPAIGFAARGSYQAWQRCDDGELEDGEGARFSSEELLAHLAKRSNDEGVLLLQPRLRNHPSLAAFLGVPALCCVRVTTCRFPDGRVELGTWSVLKRGQEGAVVDNVAGGDTIRYGVDFETGELSTRLEEQPVYLDATGERARVERWSEILDLCRRAQAEVLPEAAAVGWDVALTPDGPILVEANVTYSGHGTAGSAGPYCGEEPIAPCLLEHLRRIDRDDVRRLRGLRRETR